MAPSLMDKARSKHIMSSATFKAGSVTSAPKNPHHGPMNRYPMLRPPTRKARACVSRKPSRNTQADFDDLLTVQFKQKWWRTKRNNNGCEGFNMADEVLRPPPDIAVTTELALDPLRFRCSGFGRRGSGITSGRTARA